MSAQFQGKRALVTGGNKGIGFVVCQGLINQGFEVILAARSLDKAQAAIEQLNSSNVRPLELDVGDDNSIKLAAKNLSQEINSLDILINNAGIYPDEGVDILTASRELLARTMNVNAFGAIRVTQAFLPLLTKSSNARVVNTSSGYGQLSGLSADVPSYCLSKLTLNGATIMLSEILQHKGIVVNAIDPGWVKTNMGGNNAPRTPEQGADTAIWLATVAPSNLSGKLFYERQEVPY
ncbi:MAG: Fatty acyl-CoA reductase [Chroococcidiopsis cubana SAG 39.79]|uniref:Short-chain dehydrogenase n=2 Tax=Chroococcidiopsis TaxID=54298 RepID=A0AB37UB81_9CYAN|nr:SDR family oxidoreductase [Chroococcidiopsis cubana]MDZ4872154.1 Fatty acyl-CoA reductase [Chroococcidiopsis cubana SAG 39.79]RUT04141.1 short-chain dehydrogenase [Chroococcidiopsis cubana SAG 39.79]